MANTFMCRPFGRAELMKGNYHAKARAIMIRAKQRSHIRVENSRLIIQGEVRSIFVSGGSV